MAQTEFRVGDVIEVKFWGNHIAVVIDINESNGLCCNWILSPGPRFHYRHTNPTCDVWLSPEYEWLTTITHIEVSNDTI